MRIIYLQQWVPDSVVMEDSPNLLNRPGQRLETPKSGRHLSLLRTAHGGQDVVHHPHIPNHLWEEQAWWIEEFSQAQSTMNSVLREENHGF